MTNVLFEFSAIWYLFGISMLAPAAFAVPSREKPDGMFDTIVIDVLTILIAGSIAFAVCGSARRVNASESFIFLIVV